MVLFVSSCFRSKLIKINWSWSLSSDIDFSKYMTSLRFLQYQKYHHLMPFLFNLLSWWPFIFNYAMCLCILRWFKLAPLFIIQAEGYRLMPNLSTTFHALVWYWMSHDQHCVNMCTMTHRLQPPVIVSSITFHGNILVWTSSFYGLHYVPIVL